ncbi:MAG: SigE family RNA polymerase sigma factor [Geodermatophilaceae bacterium]|nr:SigE family RNA polymerase sigma factor [Geodermatophilaceae bacterium]
MLARWAPLLAPAYLVTGDRGIAEDCVQEALTSLHRHWRRFGPQDNREAYARRAVINAALSWRRRRRVAEVSLDVAGDPAARAELSGDLDSDLVLALRELPPRMRTAVVLRYVEDRSEAEAAELLSCSVGTVKSSCHRGLARLRRNLASTSIAALQHVGRADDDQSRG